MQTVRPDMYQALAIAVIVLPISRESVARIEFPRRYCIPAPVVSGLVFTIVHAVFRGTGIMELDMNATLQKVFMTALFHSAGHMAASGMLKKGGIGVTLFPGISAVMRVTQNPVDAIGVKAFGLDPRTGLAMGSIPLVGGHGIAGSQGPFLENFDIANATTVVVAAATYGLILGCMIDDPIVYGKIKKFGLKPKGLNANGTREAHPITAVDVPVDTVALDKNNVLNAALHIAVAVGAGTVVPFFIDRVLMMPTYIGVMIVDAIIRNIQEARGVKMPTGKMNALGNVCPSFSLAPAMRNLKLWQLVNLAALMIVILLIETVVMWFYAPIVAFNVTDRDYDAATISSGLYGLGMGATPNAMVNMQAITNIYGPAPVASMIVPPVGSLSIDFVNGLITTGFVGFLISFSHL